MPRFGSDYESLIIPEPGVLYSWSADDNTVKVKFDRSMDPVTTENIANYSFNSGLTITGASLNVDGDIVSLFTGTQTYNTVDSVVVNGVCDINTICMTTPVHDLVHLGLTSIFDIQTPDAGGDSSQFVGHIVRVTGLVTADSTMVYENQFYISDESGPPQNGVYMYMGGYVGGGPLMGDEVMFVAAVDEYYNSTELVDLGDFQEAIIVLSSGNTPEPIQVNAADLMDDVAEPYEGTFVTVCEELEVIDEDMGQFGFVVASTTTPSDTFIVYNRTDHTHYTYVPVVGAIIDGLTGVCNYTYSHHRLIPRGDFDFDTYATYCGGGPGCDYVVGDANNSASFNGLDVTYGVAYFKGGPAPPYTCECTPGNTWYVAGDVNASCGYNGLDITYSVSYFKGGAAPVPCGDCPPTGILGEETNPVSPTIDVEKRETVKRGLSE